MTAGHLLAAPDRIVPKLEPILKEHGISCELEYSKECDHQTYVIDLTSMICKTAKTQVGMGIEKRRGGKGVDITLAPGCRSFFRRDLDSEELAEKIADILCNHGARKDPHANCEAWNNNPLQRSGGSTVATFRNFTCRHSLNGVVMRRKPKNLPKNLPKKLSAVAFSLCWSPFHNTLSGTEHIRGAYLPKELTMKTTVSLTVLILAFCATIGLISVCPLFADFGVVNRGTWPDDWPNELEKLRERSRTLEGPRQPSLNYAISFKTRDEFEAAWPYLLKVKTKGAPIVLRRGPSFWLENEKNAGVCVHTPPKGQVPIADGKDSKGNWETTNYIELIVDGETVDLNRILLPPDTPIIDERFQEGITKR